MLRLERKVFYRVKDGQTLAEIARAFCVSEYLLVKSNGLNAPPFSGQILRIPDERGNAYVAKAQESKKLLCGGDESFRKKNGTDVLYPGMRVIT